VELGLLADALLFGWLVRLLGTALEKKLVSGTVRTGGEATI